MSKTTVLENQILLTKEGYDTLLEEYNDLVNVKRPAIVTDIQTSRELGDLSENGFYHAAREKQAFIEGRISEIEDLLRRVKVVEDGQGKSGKVVVGTKVRLEIQSQEVVFHIVGPEEVDMSQNKISHESPIGNALMGKKVGDTIQIEAPIGKVVYKILEIK